MTSGDYVQTKLRAWAQREGLQLQGSAGGRGTRNYTLSVEKNVFGNVLHPDTKAAFRIGAGGELRGAIPRMAALHSSSALAVNLFQYWTAKKDFASIGRLLDVPSRGISEVQFEHCCPVCADPESRGFNEPPHLDLGIEYGGRGRVGVECKLFEPYGRLSATHLRQPYLDLKEAWTGIPEWRRLAEDLTKSSAGYRRLGVAQLVKHVLGLRFGQAADRVRLIYLYYDAIGEEAAEHRTEITRFQKRVAADAVAFVPLTVQDFIRRSVMRFRETHSNYVNYLTARYL